MSFEVVMEDGWGWVGEIAPIHPAGQWVVWEVGKSEVWKMGDRDGEVEVRGNRLGVVVSWPMFAEERNRWVWWKGEMDG